MTKKELLIRLKNLGPISDEQRNEITCALVGHSKIQTFCFGYFSCARCGTQLGDSLGGCYPDAPNVVIVGHECPTCHENYKKLTWNDKIFCPDPFEQKKARPCTNTNEQKEGQ